MGVSRRDMCGVWEVVFIVLLIWVCVISGLLFFLLSFLHFVSFPLLHEREKLRSERYI